MTATRAESSTSQLRHPFYVGEDGVNRPAGPDKHPLYSQFAGSGPGVVPVVRTVNGRDMDALLICRHEDVKEVLRNPVFSREHAAEADDVDVSGTILGMDGELHAHVRGIVKDAFTRQAIMGLRARVEGEAAALAREMTGRGDEGELIEDFGLPLALHTICDMLGLPKADRRQFGVWGELFLGTSDLTREQAAQSAEEMGAYFAGQILDRRQHPADDLLTRVAHGGSQVPDENRLAVQIGLAIALVVGGWDTVASSIARYVYVLRTRPYARYTTAWDYLIDHPGQVDNAVTELERLYSTSTGDSMPRRVMADIVLPSGSRLSKGDIVIPSHDAANRDPAVFPDPERIDFDRRHGPTPHLSFGYGAHYCIGVHLGGMEVRTAISTLIRDIPSLDLAVLPDQVAWKAGHTITTPEKLPVTW